MITPNITFDTFRLIELSNRVSEIIRLHPEFAGPIRDLLLGYRPYPIVSSAAEDDVWPNIRVTVEPELNLTAAIRVLIGEERAEFFGIGWGKTGRAARRSIVA